VGCILIGIILRLFVLPLFWSPLVPPSRIRPPCACVPTHVRVFILVPVLGTRDVNGIDILGECRRSPGGTIAPTYTP
jgi:hypothetical protein